jgi:hypothetical protein
MLVIAALLLVSFALWVFGMIAEKRWLGHFLGVLGLAVWSVTLYGSVEDRSTLDAIMGFTIIGAAISELIAVSVWRTRVVPPFIRVREPIIRRIGGIVGDCGISYLFAGYREVL